MCWSRAMRRCIRSSSTSRDRRRSASVDGAKLKGLERELQPFCLFIERTTFWGVPVSNWLREHCTTLELVIPTERSSPCHFLLRPCCGVRLLLPRLRSLPRHFLPYLPPSPRTDLRTIFPVPVMAPAAVRKLRCCRRLPLLLRHSMILRTAALELVAAT